MTDAELASVYSSTLPDRWPHDAYLPGLRAVAAAARREALDAEADLIKELAEMYTETDMSRSKYLLGEIEFAIRSRAGGV